jgi:malic enzyme
MEGKSVLFKILGGINAFELYITTKGKEFKIIEQKNR